MELLLEIVTPEHKVMSDPVDGVVIPTSEGEVGVLPGHIPLMAALIPGELRITRGGSEEIMAVDQGFIQVFGDKVSLLTEGAVDVREIDLSSVEEARARAEKALREARESQADPAEIEQYEQIVRFSLAQRLVKQRRS